MVYRILDFLIASTMLILTAPILVPAMIAVWWQDGYSPFYVAPRVAKGGGIFKMIKLRSMIKNADKSGVDSTSNNDRRITAVGHFVRRYKLDELPQLFNVIKGDMSLVGPRPNVKRDTDLYTTVEQRLLTARPGITDLASIVFADEGHILKDSKDPDIDYNQLIRPWKSRLALVFVDTPSVSLYFRILILTAKAIVARGEALLGVSEVLSEMKAPVELIEVARRQMQLVPTPPPGATEIVTSR
jgi:lipopolysaccharide/colanic/teichoic acid biosynthesis glycosyltransferase